jgi:phosphate transport system substrate-binding protein
MKKILLSILATISFSASAIDAEIASYQKVEGVSGSLSSVGSDTLANLMTLWAEEFKRLYPNVTVQIQAAGSATAPPALTEGTATLGPMSRMMKSEEVEAFEAKHGYKPTAIPVAVDALAIFVNKDNQLTSISIPQVDAIYSATRACGHDSDISQWSDLGLSGDLGSQRIQLFGRNSASGTYGYFKESALCKGDFKSSVNEQPGSASVVQGVTKSLNGIGYSGIGYKTSSVKALPLSRKTGGEAIEPTPENAISGKYPLARYLYVYVNKHPNEPLAPLEKEFVLMVLSKTGQAIVVKDGYVALPAKVAQKAQTLVK